MRVRALARSVTRSSMSKLAGPFDAYFRIEGFLALPFQPVPDQAHFGFGQVLGLAHQLGVQELEFLLQGHAAFGLPAHFHGGQAAGVG